MLSTCDVRGGCEPDLLVLYYKIIRKPLLSSDVSHPDKWIPFLSSFILFKKKCLFTFEKRRGKERGGTEDPKQAAC